MKGTHQILKRNLIWKKIYFSYTRCLFPYIVETPCLQKTRDLQKNTHSLSTSFYAQVASPCSRGLWRSQISRPQKSSAPTAFTGANGWRSATVVREYRWISHNLPVGLLVTQSNRFDAVVLICDQSELPTRIALPLVRAPWAPTRSEPENFGKWNILLTLQMIFLDTTGSYQPGFLIAKKSPPTHGPAGPNLWKYHHRSIPTCQRCNDPNPRNGCGPCKCFWVSKLRPSKKRLWEG